MALVDLPQRPVCRQAIWTPIDFGGTVQGALGGSAQRVNRLGNRWAVSVVLPMMSIEEAREWSADLVRGIRTGVRWKVRQAGLRTGSPGGPVVDGAGQAGDTLSVRGFNPGYVARKSQFFSLVSGGRRYGSKLAAPFRVGADGSAVLSFDPPLRVEPEDGEVLEFGAPIIEGLLEDLPSEPDDASRLTAGFSFTIREAR